MSLTIERKTPWKNQRRKQVNHERNLHEAVAEFLDRALPADCYWFPVPNGATMTPRHAAMLKRTGQLKPGVPDIGFVWQGRSAFVELKAGKNDLTDTQREAAVAITLAKGVVMTCRSVAEVAGFLDAMQIPLKARLT